MQIQARHPNDVEQLRQRSRQQRDAKQRDRYRAVLLALEGHSAPAIAQTRARGSKSGSKDEARVGQQGTLTRCWGRRGSHPTAVRQTEYEWLYVFAGPVCIAEE